ncbi:hypothetical protein CR513_40378, partial [Mucuna pruriens]
MEKNMNVTRSPCRVKKGKRLGNLNCRRVLLCLLLRQSLILFKMNIGYSVIVRVQFILHIDVRYHWICDALDAKLLELTKVHTNDNDADMMTKRVSRGKLSDWWSPPHSCDEGDMLDSFLDSQLCGQKLNILKLARFLFIRREGVRLSRDTQKHRDPESVNFHKAKERRERRREREKENLKE